MSEDGIVACSKSSTSTLCKETQSNHKNKSNIEIKEEFESTSSTFSKETVINSYDKSNIEIQEFESLLVENEFIQPFGKPKPLKQHKTPEHKERLNSTADKCNPSECPVETRSESPTNKAQHLNVSYFISLDDKDDEQTNTTPKPQPLVRSKTFVKTSAFSQQRTLSQPFKNVNSQTNTPEKTKKQDSSTVERTAKSSPYLKGYTKVHTAPLNAGLSVRQGENAKYTLKSPTSAECKSPFCLKTVDREWFHAEPNEQRTRTFIKTNKSQPTTTGRPVSAPKTETLARNSVPKKAALPLAQTNRKAYSPSEFVTCTRSLVSNRPRTSVSHNATAMSTSIIPLKMSQLKTGSPHKSEAGKQGLTGKLLSQARQSPCMRTGLSKMSQAKQNTVDLLVKKGSPPICGRVNNLTTNKSSYLNRPFSFTNQGYSQGTNPPVARSEVVCKKTSPIKVAYDNTSRPRSATLTMSNNMARSVLALRPATAVAKNPQSFKAQPSATPLKTANANQVKVQPRPATSLKLESKPKVLNLEKKRSKTIKSTTYSKLLNPTSQRSYALPRVEVITRSDTNIQSHGCDIAGKVDCNITATARDSERKQSSNKTVNPQKVTYGSNGTSLVKKTAKINIPLKKESL